MVIHGSSSYSTCPDSWLYNSSSSSSTSWVLSDFLAMWHLPKGWSKVNAKSASIHDLASQSDLPEPCFTATARGNPVWHSPSGCLPKESPAGKHHGWWFSGTIGMRNFNGLLLNVSPFIYGKLFTEVKCLDRQQRMYLPTCLSLWFLITREFEIQQYQRQLFLVEHCVSWYALHTMTWHRSVQPCCNKNPQDKVILIGFSSWMRTIHQFYCYFTMPLKMYVYL